MNNYAELKKRILERIRKISVPPFKDVDRATVYAFKWTLREIEVIEKLEIKLDKIIKEDTSGLLDDKRDMVKKDIEKGASEDNKKLLNTMIKKGKLEIITADLSKF